MAKPRFGLGRGLDALIPGANTVPEESAPPTPIPQATPLEAPITSIQPNPSQPRGPISEDAALHELADSIKEHGVIQPLVVTELPEEDQAPSQRGGEIVRYQLIAGERRWRASKLAGLLKVPVIVREASPQQILELALIENIQRADLNPMEEARAYQTLVSDYGLTQDEVGKRVGKSRESIANTIRLLALPVVAQEKLAVRSQEFTAGHARAVLRIQNEDAQRQAIQEIVEQGLTVRESENLARRMIDLSVQYQPQVQSLPASQPQVSGQPQGQPQLPGQVPVPGQPQVVGQPQVAGQPQPPAGENFSLVRALEDDFREALALKVQLRRNAQDQGSLTIFFNNEEELNKLFELLVASRQDVH